MPVQGRKPEDVSGECLPAAIWMGIKTAAYSLALSSGIFYFVNKRSDMFRRNFNVSAKTSLVVSE